MNPGNDNRKIYIVTSMCCLVTWVYVGLIWNCSLDSPGQSCYFISLFGIPCPVCGGSHAIQSLVHGQWSAAIQYNPLVTILLLLTVLVSLILLYDLLLRKTVWMNTLSRFYALIQNKKVSFTLALILIIHWYFNIIKYMKG